MVSEEQLLVNLGKRLRLARQAARLSQRGLAEKAGVSQPAVAHMEAGSTETPISTLQKVAYALGHTLSGILLGIEADPHTKNESDS